MELEKPIVAPFKILVIVAHPDDIEFGSAGSVAVWTGAGAEVTYCIVTDGAAGSNDKDVVYNQLVERRQAEQLEAAELVGVKDVVFLGYADGALTPSLELRRDLTRLIRRLRPDRVLIMDPTQVLISGEGFDYINHPDHRATGEASLYAIFPSAETRPIFPELLDEGLEPHHVNEVYLMMSDKPNIAIDVTAVWDKKIQSLLAHRSQVGEDVADMIRRWDEATGKEVGVPLAENYRVMRFINATPEKDTPAE
ncbi:MAG: PIG-L family deacetylase [Chloroflexi bacterium]|uniref:PIG-L deacetylase family protein n=1 Tax=Candidatus Flexifilum breve TaxID=3140694 RepID=UPI0031350C0A|nr:PIG-L family deacetylase [Chloroflexota bacterium]